MKKITRVYINNYGDQVIDLWADDKQFRLKAKDLAEVIDYFNWKKDTPRVYTYLTKPKLKKKFGKS